MNIYITLDYELFMGNNTGSVENCLKIPVGKLIDIADKHGVKFTFYVDAAYLYRLYQLKGISTRLMSDYDEVCRNIQLLDKMGHDVELHFHPQWLYSNYQDGKWLMDMTHYKLSDMNEDFLQESFCACKKHLDSLLHTPTISYRAGGYSISTYKGFQSLFKKNNIIVDSSVLRDAFCKSEYQSYDYRELPSKTIYRFRSNLTTEDKAGSIIEASISTKKLSGLYYILYRLFVKFRYRQNQSFGDGVSISGGSRSLFSSKRINASIDHYEIFLLKKFLKQSGDLIVIGHPKNQSEDSIKYLDTFIGKTSIKHAYKTIRDLL